MPTTLYLQEELDITKSRSFKSLPLEVSTNNNGHPGRLETWIIRWMMKIKLFWLAVIIIKNPSKIITTFKQMLILRENIWAGDFKKIQKTGSRYYVNQYYPGWPSREYDSMIKREMRRKAFPGIKEKLSFIFLAITRKCPLHCEHCFEWENLNKKETFTKQDLIKIIDLYQQEGVLQIHFSGGEPMVRINDLADLIKYSSPKSECWVLTSGFNFTPRNALILKEAGCTGVVVSIDHYIPELHNKFRGHNNSFEMAVGAVKAAKAAGLVTSVSVCATRAFIDGKHLMPYLHFVKQLGVQFVQVLEPELTGNYEGKDVLLNKSQVHELEEIYKRVNHSPAFWHYPTIIYHGYHERRIGCFSGSRRVYIDSAGDVHACPFCHTKAYNVIELLRNHKKELPQMEIACQLFNKIA